MPRLQPLTNSTKIRTFALPNLLFSFAHLKSAHPHIRRSLLLLLLHHFHITLVTVFRRVGHHTGGVSFGDLVLAVN